MDQVGMVEKRALIWPSRLSQPNLVRVPSVVLNSVLSSRECSPTVKLKGMLIVLLRDDCAETETAVITSRRLINLNFLKVSFFMFPPLVPFGFGQRLGRPYFLKRKLVRREAKPPIIS